MPKATINTSITEATGMTGGAVKMLLLDMFATDVFLDLMMQLYVILCDCCCSEISPDAI